MFDSDITAPISGVGQCAASQSGTEKTGVSLIRIAANTALFQLEENQGIRIDDTPEMRVGSGVNASLSQTGADTLNNANNILPARSAVVTVVNNNVISNITNVKEYWDARYSTKTYSSGFIIDTIEGLKGAGMKAHPNAVNGGPVYDDTLFSNRGGLVGSANSCLQFLEEFTSGVTATIFLALDIPASASNAQISGFANTDGGKETRARAFIHSSGNLNYNRTQTSLFPTLVSNPTGTQGILCLRFNAVDSMDYYWNTATPDGNIDPHSNFSSKSNYQIFADGGSTNGVPDLGVGSFIFSEEALLDAEINTVMNELGSEFGVAIT